MVIAGLDPAAAATIKLIHELEARLQPMRGGVTQDMFLHVVNHFREKGPSWHDVDAALQHDVLEEVDTATGSEADPVEHQGETLAEGVPQGAGAGEQFAGGEQETWEVHPDADDHYHHGGRAGGDDKQQIGDHSGTDGVPTGHHQLTDDSAGNAGINQSLGNAETGEVGHDDVNMQEASFAAEPQDAAQGSDYDDVDGMVNTETSNQEAAAQQQHLDEDVFSKHIAQHTARPHTAEAERTAE